MKADHLSGSTNPRTQRNLCSILHEFILAVTLLVLGSGAVIAADFHLDGADTTSAVSGETYFHNLTASTTAAHKMLLESD